MRRMLRTFDRLLVLPAALCLLTRAEATPDRLHDLFLAANANPELIPTLIVEGSAALERIDGESAALLADTLEPYCRRAFFGPERWDTMERLGLSEYTVRAGELPGSIARAHGIGAGMLGFLNDGYDERRVAVGQRLKLLRLDDGDLELVVDKTHYRLAAWRRLPGGAGRALVAYLPIGLGALESATPTGRTHITIRVLDPEWTHPVTRQVYPPQHAENVLGGYWIALDERGLGKRGIGLHGFTGDVPERWIERPASNGCIRLLQPHVDRVFHLALEGTTVVVLP